MALRDQDAFLNQFTLALQRSILSDDAFADALKLMAERFRCLSAAIVYVDEGLPGATIEAGHGVLDASARQRYREDYSREDPAPAAMARLNVGEVATTDHLFDTRDASLARFLNEFYFPLGLRGAMGGPVVKAHGRLGVLAVQRGDDRPAFGPKETADFASLVPLVASTLALRRKFYELETGMETLHHALEDVSVAIMIFHPGGRLRHANRVARQFLERQDGLLLTRTGKLKLVDAAANQRLQGLFVDRREASRLIMRVPRKADAAPYVLRALPSSGDIMVKICDLLSANVEADALLQLAFDMPPASARLTAALLHGRTISEHAAQTGLSPNTIKFHLKSAFAATSTKRQSDLVRVASVLIRDIGVQTSAEQEKLARERGEKPWEP